MSLALQELGFKKTAEGVRLARTGKEWVALWSKAYELLQQANLLYAVEVEINTDEVSSAPRKTPQQIQHIAESLWLGEALLDDRVMCYFQPIMSRQDKVFGYESFARARMADSTVVAGNKIVPASKALGIEYMIDRQLHVQAIQTFAKSACAGFLFINFFPGFIHRPAVYLEGLSEAAKLYGIVPQHLVLEFTRAETQSDLQHLKNVCEYGRSKGYSIALDDIMTLEGARKLIPEIKPDFVKIDMQPPAKIHDPGWMKTIGKIAELVHASGGTVVGEGIESAELHQQLKNVGVDLFQGYLFSPPSPVEAVAQKYTG